MTKDKNKKVKLKIESFLEDFDFIVGTQHWDKTLVIKDEDKDNQLASVECDRKYKRLTINIYPCFFKENPKSQAETLVHEMVHVLIDPLQQVANDMLEGHLVTRRCFSHALEESTSSVTEIMVRLLDDKLRYAKKAFAKYKKK